LNAAALFGHENTLGGCAQFCLREKLTACFNPRSRCLQHVEAAHCCDTIRFCAEFHRHVKIVYYPNNTVHVFTVNLKTQRKICFKY